MTKNCCFLQLVIRLGLLEFEGMKRLLYTVLCEVRRLRKSWKRAWKYASMNWTRLTSLPQVCLLFVFFCGIFYIIFFCIGEASLSCTCLFSFLTCHPPKSVFSKLGLPSFSMRIRRRAIIYVAWEQLDFGTLFLFFFVKKSESVHSFRKGLIDFYASSFKDIHHFFSLM